MLRVGLQSRLPLQRRHHGGPRRRRGSAGRSADFGGLRGARIGNIGAARHVAMTTSNLALRWRWPLRLSQRVSRQSYPRGLPRAYDPSHPAPTRGRFRRRPKSVGRAAATFDAGQRSRGSEGASRPPPG
jgi:hypothetical protein